MLRYRITRAISLTLVFTGVILAGTACRPSNKLVAQALTQPPVLTPSSTSTSLPAFTPTPLPTNTPTLTPTHSPSPSITLTPTITLTSSITPTPTFDFPDVTVHTQAHCRYGPSTGYLHAADLYPGDAGSVRGRNGSGTWLYVKFDKLDYFCWAAASVLDIQGDIFTVYQAQVKPPRSDLYGPPGDVSASREGDTVTVRWSRVPMTLDDDRGYMIEAYVCQDGNYVFLTISTNDNYYKFTDSQNCSQASGGLLYTVDKYGYSEPVPIPWP